MLSRAVFPPSNDGEHHFVSIRFNMNSNLIFRRMIPISYFFSLPRFWSFRQESMGKNSVCGSKDNIIFGQLTKLTRRQRKVICLRENLSTTSHYIPEHDELL